LAEEAEKHVAEEVLAAEVVGVVLRLVFVFVFVHFIVFKG
jgi:hypothetical protein